MFEEPKPRRLVVVSSVHNSAALLGIVDNHPIAVAFWGHHEHVRDFQAVINPNPLSTFLSHR